MITRLLLISFTVLLSCSCSSAKLSEGGGDIITPFNTDKYMVRMYLTESLYETKLKIKVLREYDGKQFAGLKIFLMGKSGKLSDNFFSSTVSGCVTVRGVEMFYVTVDKKIILPHQVGLSLFFEEKGGSSEIFAVDVPSFVNLYREFYSEDKDTSWWAGLGEFNPKISLDLFDKRYDCG